MRGDADQCRFMPAQGEGRIADADGNRIPGGKGFRDHADGFALDEPELQEAAFQRGMVRAAAVKRAEDAGGIALPEMAEAKALACALLVLIFWHGQPSRFAIWSLPTWQTASETP
jgi:hypothetical protein